MDITKCGLAPMTEKALVAKKILTAEEFMGIRPIGCRDFTKRTMLADAVGREECVIRGRLDRYIFLDKRPSVLTAIMTEPGTMTEFSVTWFAQDFRKKFLEAMQHEMIDVVGKVQWSSEYGYQINTPEIFTEAKYFKPGIYPKYREIKGVSMDMQISLHQKLSCYVSETLEFPVLEKLGLEDLRSTYWRLHFPRTVKEFEDAEKALRYRELLYFSANMQAAYPKTGTGTRLSKTALADAYVALLPYSLTEDQRKAIEEMKAEATSGRRIHMLIQGDVGCGKTVCAFYAMFLAIGSGKQAVLTAPTNVLASQHYADFCSYAARLSQLGYKISPGFLSVNLKGRAKKDVAARLASGEINAVIGTHATFSDAYEYKDLAMVIVDEEHRFGVKQRDSLKDKANSGAHVISLSATPIPRSLATVLFGNCTTIQEIKTMPAGRQKVKSCQCEDDARAFRFIESQLREGRQCYVVCPLVKTNEDIQKASIEDAMARYRSFFAPLGYTVDCAHGKMKKTELQDRLDRFKDGKIHVLIATTVIEVGVNVPNANVIVIENAEQFGLAALHQLRGRVGRGQYQSYCIFKSACVDNPRLKAILGTTDGFKIAEADLELRGSGNLIGLEQTGFNKYVSLSIEYPDEYRRASEDAKWMLQKGYTNILVNQDYEDDDD